MDGLPYRINADGERQPHPAHSGRVCGRETTNERSVDIHVEEKCRWAFTAPLRRNTRLPAHIANKIFPIESFCTQRPNRGSRAYQARHSPCCSGPGTPGFSGVIPRRLNENKRPAALTVFHSLCPVRAGVQAAGDLASDQGGGPPHGGDGREEGRDDQPAEKGRPRGIHQPQSPPNFSTQRTIG